ncbi:MAG: hypothetical protein ACXVX8_18295 [Blastococcus sp.]
MPSPSATLVAARRQPLPPREAAAEPSREAALIWSLESLVRYAVTAAAASVVVVGAWFNVSGKNDWNTQVAAVNVAVIAVIVSNAAGIGLLVNGRRRIGLRREALLGDPGLPAEEATVVVELPAQRGPVTLVGGAGLLHFHRSDCAMAQGRDWPAATASEHARAGRSACGVCRP